MNEQLANEMWERFIKHLNDTQPIMVKKDKQQMQVPHVNFLGSIEAYRKVFVEANNGKPE